MGVPLWLAQITAIRGRRARVRFLTSPSNYWFSEPPKMFGNTVIGNSSLVISVFFCFSSSPPPLPPCPLYSGLGGHDLTIFSNEMYKHTSHLHPSHCPFYDVGGGGSKRALFWDHNRWQTYTHTHTHTHSSHTHTHSSQHVYTGPFMVLWGCALTGVEFFFFYKKWANIIRSHYIKLLHLNLKKSRFILIFFLSSINVEFFLVMFQQRSMIDWNYVYSINYYDNCHIFLNTI